MIAVANGLQDHSYANVYPSARQVGSPSLADQAGDIDGLASLPGGTAAGGLVATPAVGSGGGRSKRKQAPMKEADPWEGSVTRCICNFTHDDGFMICCDICGYVHSDRHFRLVVVHSQLDLRC